MAYRVVKYLERKEIDTGKWDDCVRRNDNGLIYASSRYLDAMAVNWNAVVVGDYDAVMPLPWRKKFGIRYHFRPPFTQQLGIIGDVSLIPTRDLPKLITTRIRYGTLMFNYSNAVTASLKGAEQHANLIIDLSAGYDDIRSRYRPGTGNSIRNAGRRALVYADSDNTNEIINLYKRLYGARVPSITQADYHRFRSLCAGYAADDCVVARTVSDSNGSVLASALLLRDGKRLYNLVNSATSQGRLAEANYFLMDSLIREFSGQRMLLDLEGSDIEGVKAFYEKFGAVDQPYYYWSYNYLPFPVGFIKRLLSAAGGSSRPAAGRQDRSL